MNLILLSEDDFLDGKKVHIAGRRLQHVMDVHRARAGDILKVGLEGGRIGTGLVTSIDTAGLEMEIALDEVPPRPVPVTLLLSLPRPKALRRVLFSITTMGIKRVFLINAYRVEKSFWQSPVLDAAAIRQRLVLGLEQARDTILPEIFLRRRFKPFVEDELPGIGEGALKFVAHPGASEQLGKCGCRPVVLALGPEGGFIQYEIEMLISAGFSPVSAGERILPVETAVPFLVSRLL